MLIAYIDETGDTGSLSKRGASACYGLGCVVIDADKWPDAIDRMLLLRRDLRGRHGVLIRKELKSTQIISGSGALTGLALPPYVRRGIFRAHLEAVRDFGGRAFSIIVDKRVHPHADWFHLAWETLLQRLERLSYFDEGQNMLIVHDDGENLKVRGEVRKARVYLTAGRIAGGGQFRFAAPIIEDSIPRDSASSYMLQLADIVAYAGWRTYVPPSRFVAQVVQPTTWDALGAAIHRPVNRLKLNGSVPGVVLR
ncbi:DUF3800 domain-containing protein [Herbiconiux liukaitaii]|uniref:DUF3800 domain-containing protein n=1 Tax=Herbiconiux liukaitaii TaxID=3342799 RepID=UPI0035BB15FC